MRGPEQYSGSGICLAHRLIWVLFLTHQIVPWFLSVVLSWCRTKIKTWAVPEIPPKLSPRKKKKVFCSCIIWLFSISFSSYSYMGAIFFNFFVRRNWFSILSDYNVSLFIISIYLHILDILNVHIYRMGVCKSMITET